MTSIQQRKAGPVTYPEEDGKVSESAKHYAQGADVFEIFPSSATSVTSVPAFATSPPGGHAASAVRHFSPARGGTRIALARYRRPHLVARQQNMGLPGAMGRDLAGSFRQGSLRLPMAVWTAISIVLVVGSRTLLTHGIPAVGQLAPLPDGLGTPH